jgi:23S rRNA (cytidine1920-2'-O)/16S rRNA (cytidine1409-2'-O)-methyltransferase
MEKTNFRYLEPKQLEGPEPTFASIDVSFISLKLILPTLAALIAEGSGVVALIKPQFEAGRDKVGKSGVVREPSVHLEVLKSVIGSASTIGYELKDITFSPITGGEGNIEFLAYWVWQGKPGAAKPSEEELSKLVKEANDTFKVPNK